MKLYDLLGLNPSIPVSELSGNNLKNFQLQHNLGDLVEFKKLISPRSLKFNLIVQENVILTYG